MEKRIKPIEKRIAKPATMTRRKVEIKEVIPSKTVDWERGVKISGGIEF